jgi:hypothetical protein
MRVFDQSWTMDAVAREMRIAARLGFNRGAGDPASVAYVQNCTALYLPQDTQLVFTRDDIQGFIKCWHLGVFRFTDQGFVPVEERKALAWCALFFAGELHDVQRTYARHDPEEQKRKHHFVLGVEDWEGDKTGRLIV